MLGRRRGGCAGPAEVPAVTEFLQHMLADDASPASLRS